MPTLLVAHLHFCRHTNPKRKCKRATSQRTTTDQNERTKQHTDKKGEPITRYCQKRG